MSWPPPAPSPAEMKKANIDMLQSVSPIPGNVSRTTTKPPDVWIEKKTLTKNSACAIPGHEGMHSWAGCLANPFCEVTNSGVYADEEDNWFVLVKQTSTFKKNENMVWVPYDWHDMVFSVESIRHLTKAKVEKYIVVLEGIVSGIFEQVFLCLSDMDDSKAH